MTVSAVRAVQRKRFLFGKKLLMLCKYEICPIPDEIRQRLVKKLAQESEVLVLLGRQVDARVHLARLAAGPSLPPAIGHIVRLYTPNPPREGRGRDSSFFRELGARASARPIPILDHGNPERSRASYMRFISRHGS